MPGGRSGGHEFRSASEASTRVLRIGNRDARSRRHLQCAVRMPRKDSRTVDDLRDSDANRYSQWSPTSNAAGRRAVLARGMYGAGIRCFYLGDAGKPTIVLL